MIDLSIGYVNVPENRKMQFDKWPMRAGQERLCRESPFTAFPSEAIFAATYDQPYQ